MVVNKSKSAGELLRAARLEAGMTQSELAAKIGTVRGSIVNWETGLHHIPEPRIFQLKEVLGDFVQTPSYDADKISAFGAWLRKARSAKDFSIPQLAQKSGVSIPAIYNIENGKSINPQKETRKKLEKALGKKVPDEVTIEAEQTQQIEGLGALTDFDPYDENELPNVSGVYVFYDVSDRPMYVGKAVRIDNRVKSHRDKFWFRDPIVHRAAYIQIPDKNLRHQIEQVLIKFLKSNAVINKQSVERSADEDE
jgi:transcriptional regulator with XRE-family HTH domain